MNDLTERGGHLAANSHDVYQAREFIKRLSAADDSEDYGVSRVEKKELIDRLTELLDSIAESAATEIPAQ